MLYQDTHPRCDVAESGNPGLKTKRNSLLVDRLLYGIFAGLLLGIAALMIFLIHDRMRQPETDNSAPFKVEGSAAANGVIAIEPPIDIPAIELIDSKGSSVGLAQFRGRHVLLTFGFTHCPDICPLTLNDFERTQGLLGDLRASVAFVFVSVDGSRDTPAALRQYFEFRKFDDIHALTGDEDSVLALGQPLGLSFEISDESQSDAYLINHTTGSFLLDQAGRWIKRYQFGVPPEAMAADLRTLLGQ